MKKLRKTKPHTYPAGTLGSLKGDDGACIRYLEKRANSSRRNRRASYMRDLIVRAHAWRQVADTTIDQPNVPYP